MKRREILRFAVRFFCSFVFFFGIIAFAVTCSLLLFFSGIEINEEQVKAFAPVVFINVIFISFLIVIIDTLRRRMTVDRPAKAIKDTLSRMKGGDFEARIDLGGFIGENNRLFGIAEDINDLGEELSGIEDLRSNVIADVSHELKTPLAVIGNYGALLKAKGLDENKRIEYAEGVVENAQKLSDMVSNILRLNKLENQQIFPETKDYDLGEQLCDCLLRFESLWESKDISIETDIAEDVTVNGDSDLLGLVWNNLFSNAFKFTESGGSVSVSLKSEGDHALVCVSDTGCGMSPEVGEHIFEKFYQGDGSRATSGNGLGLALVKRVIEIVGGDISVESVLGKGSCFSVRIKRVI